ncbi:Fanconi anemia group J protein [Linnemannia schmuckeri]|uniref:DNA 5'-3' helicase n=1 Tax=Linnemannia schmuckeri TaxID=64567 RepID=A0A9P5VAT7_9FUNG|nr:Fanconi anemia group J protein [Linnemannia schmuckeri]
MGKRSRKLPPTISGSSEKAKAATAQLEQDPLKQLHLNIQLQDSSDSDINDFQGSTNNGHEPTNFKKRAKTGHFQKAKRKKNNASSEPSLTKSSPAANPTEFVTNGIRIKFPFTPYKSQQDMMSKIVEALQTQENALLESPTGSGKSLALLCGALAWLENEKVRNEVHRREIRKNLEVELAKMDVVESPYFAAEAAEPKPIVNSGCGSCASSCGTESTSNAQHGTTIATSLTPLTADDQDFQNKPAHHISARAATVLQYEDDALKASTADAVRSKDIPSLRESVPMLPKIYFGSRTHKQITQLVKELRSNTDYRPKMVVLGSRTHYCVNKRIQKAPNKNDACQELVEDDKCSYKFKANDLQDRFSAKKRGQNRIWDMEDLIEEGKDIKEIRKAMDIDLENSIVILDEAHNIEDASRDAGGLDVLDDDLRVAKTEFGDMVKNNIMAHPSNTLLNLAAMFLSILEKQTTFSIQEYEQSTEIWTSQKLLSHLNTFGVNAESIVMYDTACQEISKALKEKKEKKKLAKAVGPLLDIMDDGPDGDQFREQFVAVTPRVLRTLESIVAILKRLFSGDGYCLDDYKIALVESVDHSGRAQQIDSSTEVESDDDEAQAKKSRHTGCNKRGGWQGYGSQVARRGAQVEKKREFKFWCLNPGVIFRPLSSTTRSVILTSGTLSPMDSFASELQTRFAVQLEAGHVVDQSQVWTGVLPYGPTRVKMDGTFKSASSFQFQDELGRAVERIIQTTPHGVLCFVSSYSLMDNLVNRWRLTGQYDQFCQIKKVILEPRRATTKEFDKILKSFYDHIAAEVAMGSDGGALLFAVFRGKCSEGIDFTDSNCRAVLAVSIPYPGLNDLKIKLKKEYNDQQCQKRRRQPQGRSTGQFEGPIPGIANVNIQALNHSTGSAEKSAAHALAALQDSVESRALLSGKRWYEIQAFRAYNQAIGRCIRHRKDWGAMVLLDYRFTIPSTKNSLSRWVRPLAKIYTDFEAGIHSLKSWIEPLQHGVSIEASASSSTPTTTTIYDASRSTDPSVVQTTHLVAESQLNLVKNDPEWLETDEAEAKTVMLETMAQLDCNLFASFSCDLTPKREEELELPKVEGQQNQEAITSYAIYETAVDPAWDDSIDMTSAEGRSTDSVAPLILEQPTDKQNCEYLSNNLAGFGSEADMSGVVEEEVQESTLPAPILSSSRYDEAHGFSEMTDRTGLTASRATGSILTGLPASSSPRRDPAIFISNSASSSQQPNTSMSRPTAPFTWGINALQSFSAPTISTGDTQSTQTHGGASVLKVACKTCSELLLVCTERPKIKTVERSMAVELLAHRRRLNAALEVNAAIQASINLATQRSGTSSVTSQSRAMILTIRGSCVLEMPFQGPNEQEELECVLRPRDGLFYRRVVCPRCRVTPTVAGSTLLGLDTTAGQDQQQIIPGWKGVIIVGSLSDQLQPQQGAGDDTSEIGTVWLTPGEIKTI